MSTFEPTLPWLIVLLPLLGFVINGAMAFAAPRQKIVPTLVGPAVIGVAFVIAVITFLAMRAAGPAPWTPRRPSARPSPTPSRDVGKRAASTNARTRS